MSKQSYWRCATIVSCCIHCLLFVGAGWLGGGIFSKAAEPETIEMELISSVALPEQVAAVPITMPQAASSIAQPMTPPVTPTPSNPNPIVNAPASAAVADRFSQPAEPAAPSGSGATDVAPSAAAIGGTAGGASAAPPPAVHKSVSAPRILSKVEPDYPEDARQDGIAGTVGVKIEVLENGRTGEVRIVHSSGRSSLDEAALQAVRRWRFVPAEEDGQAIRCFTTLAVVFDLT